MRQLVWILLILTVAGWLACEIPSDRHPTASQSQLDDWRRTPRGWERADWLVPEIPARRAALHPGVVGLLELLVSLAALVAFPARLGPSGVGNRESRVGSQE